MRSIGDVPAEQRPTQAVRLLIAEPDLGSSLAPEDFQLAQRHIVLPAISAPPGALDLAELRQRPGIKGELFGFLVLKGTLIANLRMVSRHCGRLVSPGALVLLDGPISDSIPLTLDWSVVDDCQLACFDERLLEIVRRWPQMLAPILRRAALYARHSLMQQAISQLPRVEDRLLALFWSLADRQGVVRADGIWVGLSATHDTLAHLVGAQRPTVSLGLTRLTENGLIQAQPGGWLINPDSLSALTPESELSGDPV